MFISSDESSLRSETEAFFPFIFVLLFPSSEKTRRTVISPSPSGCIPRSSSTGKMFSTPEKIAVTDAFFSPGRIMSFDIRPPNTSVRPSIKMLLPAPVSPVSTEKPRPSSSSTSRATAIFSMRSIRSKRSPPDNNLFNERVYFFKIRRCLFSILKNDKYCVVSRDASEYFIAVM